MQKCRGEGEKIIRTSCLTVRCTPCLPAFKLRRNCRKWKKWRLLWQGELHNLLIRLGAWPAKYRIVPNLAIMGRDAKGDYGFYRLRILEHCKKNVYTYIVLPMELYFTCWMNDDEAVIFRCQITFKDVFVLMVFNFLAWLLHNNYWKIRSFRPFCFLNWQIKRSQKICCILPHE